MTVRNAIDSEEGYSNGGEEADNTIADDDDRKTIRGVEAGKPLGDSAVNREKIDDGQILVTPFPNTPSKPVTSVK